MISAQRRSVDVASSKTKRTGVTQPLMKTEVFSKHVTPVPPSTSAIRYEPLSRRSRKTGTLSNQRSSASCHSLSHKDAAANVPPFRSLGLEVKPEQVVWKGWEPGEEYTRNLTLKNVHVKTQKIKYKVPGSRFFSTLFPQVIVLSAGTSFTLPITFRPLEKERYDDTIEFSTASGTFNISLQALLPETNLHLPDSIHFGLVAIHDTMELSFEMKNMSSELATKFSWQVSEPFAIIPTSGLLQPTASCSPKVIFRPTTANVFDATAVCSFGQNMVKTVKLEGIGKYPHILISTSSKLPANNRSNNTMPVLKFSDINVHHQSEKFITLHNLSNVKTPFKVQRTCQTIRLDHSFSCPITSGVITPMGNFKLPITFNPQSVGNTSIEYFEVSAVGSISKSSLKCIGSSTGPNIQLNVGVINFGVVKEGKTVTRTFHITNASDCEAVYQILLDEFNSVFCVNCNSGYLAPRSSQTHIVHFTPPHSINYYRRVTILVHEQEPVFMDFIGTCHTEECKPPMLKEEHLHQYRIHVERGLSHYPPDILNSQHKEGKLVEDEDGCLMLPTDKRDISTEHQSAMDEYFDDGHNTEITHYPPHVSLDQASVWIGQVEFHTSCHVTVQLTNHTRGKITAMWIDDPAGVFEVHPSSCDVPPLKSTEFRIIFKPDAPNQFFGKELECYAFYKSMRDYRLVEGGTVAVPWLLTVDVSAHTFVGNMETFLPQTSLSTQTMTFPAVASSQNSYKTILLENKGDTPVLYQFVKTQNDGFTVKQHQGLMKSRFHISAIRLTPKKVATYHGSVTLRLNDNTKNDKTITLVGTGEQPELLLSNKGEMFFRPTCVSTTNERDYEVQNIGRIPLKFKWHFPGQISKYLSVSPIEGVIHPNEIQSHTWTFTPGAVKKYVFKPVCLTWHYHGESPQSDTYRSADAKLFAVRGVAEGFEGDIKAERCNIDFGCVITGSNSSQPLLLFNNSECDLHFRLSVEQSINSQYGEDPDENEPIGLKLNQWEAVLPARSKVIISATAHPYRRVLYTWSLYYELLNTAGEPINKNCRVLLSELSAEGVYPTLSIIDARPSGSGSSISKTQLWRWFSLEHFNTCLDSDPSTAELVYSVNTRHSTSRRPSVFTKSIMDFNFGAASIDSEPCFVSMMVKNTGLVETKWAFLFPKDMELEIDYWAETGAFDPDELHELHIQDNKLFTVKPSRGVLKPGESRTILFSYKHDVAGTHRLPVLFKIENGKEVLLNFIGVTVHLNRRYLHFPGTKHTFTPVPIGGPTPPKQLYEMYNGGCMSVIYEVAMDPLRELQEENYTHPVLTCLNPRGEIPPGTSANLEWIFSPLESKSYIVDIPIHIVGGETALITFKGIGYDGRAMGSTMPMLDQPAEFTSVPSTQKVPVPGQIMFLSEERVSFGNVPLFSRSRHVIFLCNKSLDRPLSYSWHAASELVNEVLRVEPVKGHLAPGERTMTRIMFCAVGQPSFYDLDLICEVVDEIKMAEYRSELEAWEAERDRQAQEFHITDDDVPDDVSKHDAFDVHSGPSKFSMTSPRRNLENVLNKKTTPTRLTESVVSKHSMKSEHKTFQTLPPIRFEDPVKFPSNRSRLLRQEEAGAKNEWVQPQAPKPFVSHLGVTARTHDISEFRSNFPKQSKSHFVDRNLQVAYPVLARPPDSQYPLTTCNEGEKDVVISVLGNVLRGLLDDPTFHDDVKDITSQPTPYFGQLAREEELEEDLDGDLKRASLEEEVADAQDSSDAKQDVTNEDAGIVDDTKPPETADGHEEKKDECSSAGQASSNKFMDEILRQEGSSRPSSCGTARSPRDRLGRSATTAMSSTQKRTMEQEIKRTPEFGALLEDVLSSTITNIMEEALRGDVILTARPRAVALPPSRGGDGTDKGPSPKPSLRRSALHSGSQRNRPSRSSISSVSQK